MTTESSISKVTPKDEKGNYIYGELTGYCKCGKDLGDLEPIEIEQHFLNHKRRWDI